MDANYISKEFDKLQRQLAALEQLLLLYPTFHASTACLIPPTRKGTENDPVETIEPQLYLGKHAVVHAIKCYKDLHIMHEHSTKFARQTAGAILLDGQNQKLSLNVCAAVEQINDAKNNIKAFITTNYETRNARFQALKEQCPATLTVHLYRNIRIHHNENIQSINFTWARKENLRKISSEQLVSQINQAALDYTGNDPNYTFALTQLANKISTIRDGNIRLRRVQDKPQPCVNITYADEKKTTQTQVSMPLIVIQEQPPSIKPLPNYSAENRNDRKIRSDRQERRYIATLNGSRIEVIE